MRCFVRAACFSPAASWWRWRYYRLSGLRELKFMTAIALNVILAYAIFVAIGGGIGYLKSKSRVSLWSGLGSAVLLVVAYIVGRSNQVGGLAIALGSAVALCFVFLMRLRQTGKFMPAGLMGIVSAIAAIVFAFGLT